MIRIGDEIPHRRHNAEVAHRARRIRENGRIITVDESTYVDCDGSKVRGRGCKGLIVEARFAQRKAELP